MKLPLEWLREYVDWSGTAETLEEALTLSGTKVEGVDASGGQETLELEITTNRPDCLSILGLAREVSALTGAKLRVPGSFKATIGRAKRPEIRIEDKKGCPYYTARLLEGVTIRPAPAKITRLLELAGTRAINNAVDATNWVLFEMGQPLHAFDADKIAGGAVTVRRAKKGEKFLGLDGVTYELDEETLVIADAERPIAMAGVIGGKLTEVTAATKNILLESAVFDPRLVRRAVRKYKVTTDSSYRFERSVDSKAVAAASERARSLILEWGGGAETAAAACGSPDGKPSKPITLRGERLAALLGMKVPAAKAASTLRRLGFGVRPSGKQNLIVTAPSFRRDVTQEADLAEEVLRIAGFDKVPAALPVVRHALKTEKRPKAMKLLELKKFMAASGWNEILTYSLLPMRALDEAFPRVSRSGVHRVANPVSAEQELFRPSLLPGMLGAARFNVHRKASALRLFEVGNVYKENREETMLAVGAWGAFEDNWLRKSPATLFDAKGAVENVLRFLGAGETRWQAKDAEGSYADWAEAYAGAHAIASAGVIAGEAAKNFDLPSDFFYAEIRLDAALEIASTKTFPRVKPAPKFPSVRRDMAILAAESVEVAALERTMREAAGMALESVRLFDVYAGKGIPSGKRSLAFSLEYRKETGTFTDDEIQELHKIVADVLKDRHRVEFR